MIQVSIVDDWAHEDYIEAAMSGMEKYIKAATTTTNSANTDPLTLEKLHKTIEELREARESLDAQRKLMLTDAAQLYYNQTKDRGATAKLLQSFGIPELDIVTLLEKWDHYDHE